MEQLYARIDELKTEKDRLSQELESLVIETAMPIANEQKAEAAIKELRELRKTFSKAKPEELRELIGSLVSQIDLHFTHGRRGKLNRSEFRNGTVHLRPSSMSGQPRNPEQMDNVWLSYLSKQLGTC